MYVQSNEAVAAYGWIEKTVTWDDVSDPAVLLEKAKTYLTDIQFDNLELEPQSDKRPKLQWGCPQAGYQEEQ